MEEQTLLIFFLVCAFAGVSSIYFISTNIQMDETPLILSEESVAITGKVVSVKSLEKVSIIEVERMERIPVALFDEKNVKEGDIVYIRGKITEYQGKKEVQAESIKTLK